MNLVFDHDPFLLSDEDEAVFKAARESSSPSMSALCTAVAGIPTGAVIAGHHVGAAVYAKVERDYQVYLPAQLDTTADANLIVFQDGDNYLRRTNAHVVLDNLIAGGVLPPTIAVFIEPGDLPGSPKGARGNRSLEYDSVNDAYLRFLLDELLPEAIGDYRVTADPMRRAICGMSSGGICAFNAAWERPDEFGLVLSHVASFINIRGGHIYPSRIRQNGARPFRALLQGGAGDLDNTLGHWPTANFDMAAALRFKGYDLRFEFGLCGHTFEHAAAIMPQALKWLFRA